MVGVSDSSAAGACRVYHNSTSLAQAQAQASYVAGSPVPLPLPPGPPELVRVPSVSIGQSTSLDGLCVAMLMEDEREGSICQYLRISISMRCCNSQHLTPSLRHRASQ